MTGTDGVRIRIRGSGVLLAASLAGVMAMAGRSDAAPDCRAAVPAPTLQQFDHAAQEQKRQIAILRDQMDGLACGGSITVVGSPAAIRCDELATLMDRMRGNLATIEAQRSDSASAIQSASRCAPSAQPISGVSQFLDPNGDIDDLVPRQGATPASPRDGGSITRIGPPAASDIVSLDPQPDDANAALAGPPAVVRPMTNQDRNVRRVGPRFLPDPSQSLHLRSAADSPARDD